MITDGSRKADLTIEGLVHDLNNVFTTILDAAELLETDAEWSSLAAVLERSVARGRRILDGVFESGGSVFDLEPVLDGAIQFALDCLQPQGLEISFRNSVEPELRLRGSAVAWERALYNLLINAGQAMERGGTVEISARHREDCIELTVTDDGPGIPADVLPRIFERGFSTKGRSGLGLCIAKSIIERAGGSILVDNRAGRRGALFAIRVPEHASAFAGVRDNQSLNPEIGV